MSDIIIKPKEKEREYEESDKILIIAIKGFKKLKSRLLAMEELRPEYKLVSICSDRAISTAYFTLIYRKIEEDGNE
ncbi:MAG: hypothetical protein ACXADU_13885 [Promethearchaeota archaeon]|jgi:hypothetical protein